MRTAFCSDHRPTQHRDGKPPWCRNCKLDSEGFDPDSIFGTIKGVPQSGPFEKVEAVETPIEVPETPADKPKKARELEPIEIARHLVVQEFNDNLNSFDRGREIDYDDTYIYFFAYVLGGWKAEVSTTVTDNKVYEVTYNSDKDELYIDVYVKLSNRVVSIRNFMRAFRRNH